MRNVSRVGPRPMRDVKQRDAAAEILADHYFLIPCGGVGKARRYLLNPKAHTFAQG